MLSKITITIIALTTCSIAIAGENTIKLSEIVSTSSQSNLKHASINVRGDGDFEHSYGYHLQQITLASKSGASNVFLIEAAGIHGAVRASSEVLLGGMEVSTPAQVDDKAANSNIWLVAYFGVGPSSPPAYVVKTVSLNGSRVRVAYNKARPKAVTRDIHPYFYWIPVGKLSDGTYRLELYDTELKEVTLMRRVEIE